MFPNVFPNGHISELEDDGKLVGECLGLHPDKETWWWNEEVAEAVRYKKIKYGKWNKENTKEARMEY